MINLKKLFKQIENVGGEHVKIWYIFRCKCSCHFSVILERPRVRRAVADFTSPEDSVNCQCNCPVQVVDCSKTTQPTLQPQCMLLFYHS